MFSEFWKLSLHGDHIYIIRLFYISLSIWTSAFSTERLLAFLWILPSMHPGGNCPFLWKKLDHGRILTTVPCICNQGVWTVCHKQALLCAFTGLRSSDKTCSCDTVHLLPDLFILRSMPVLDVHVIMKNAPVKEASLSLDKVRIFSYLTWNQTSYSIQCFWGRRAGYWSQPIR